MPPRTVAFDLVTETAHFTPLQIQPRALLQIAFGSLSHWLKAHLVPFPRMIRDHRTSVVIMGCSMRYLEPLRFFDCDTLGIQAGCRLLRGGSRIQLDVSFQGGSTRAATVAITLCPVRIDEDASLGAAPTRIEGELLSRFQRDEIEDGSPPRPMPDEKQRIESEGKLLSESRTGFTVYRHICEVADQWAFTEVPALCGTGREEMMRTQGEQTPALREALARPLRSFDMELTRPYFWLDRGEVETRAYRHTDRMAFVHRLVSNLPGDKVHGTIVEHF